MGQLQRQYDYSKDSGFRSDFCSNCGSPVPNPLQQTDYYWIPAGLIEDSESLEIVSHLFLSSKASWDKENPNAQEHMGFPGIEEHIKTLNQTD